MFDRFTDRARKVMGLSRQEAQRFNHDYIGTEHILLGILAEGGGVACEVFKNLDVSLVKVREEVTKLVSVGTMIVTMGQLPFTPRAKKVLEMALTEASGLGHTYIGTEHLLLGLISESEGIAAQVLRNLRVMATDVRTEIHEVLGAEPKIERPAVADTSTQDVIEKVAAWSIGFPGKPMTVKIEVTGPAADVAALMRSFMAGGK